MERGASLDGKAARSVPRERPKKAAQNGTNDSSKTTIKRESEANLRPASPPKVNPWVRRQRPEATLTESSFASISDSNDGSTRLLFKGMDGTENIEQEHEKQEVLSWLSPKTTRNESLSADHIEALECESKFSETLKSSEPEDQDPREAHESHNSFEARPLNTVRSVTSDSMDRSSETGARVRASGEQVDSEQVDSEQVVRRRLDSPFEVEGMFAGRGVTLSSASCSSQTGDSPPNVHSMNASIAPDSSSSSNESRRMLRAAIERADANLWKHPVGSDVEILCGSWSFKVHRGIITKHSKWFRDHMPPPREDGMPTKLRFRCAPETLGYGLRFMYTHKIEIFDKGNTLDTKCLPRCVLTYSVAVYLQVTSMVTYALRMFEDISNDLEDSMRTGKLVLSMECNQGGVFASPHLHDALDLMYSQPAQTMMKPMRLAMAGLLDRIFFWLVSHANFRMQLNLPAWDVWLPRIRDDQAEYRRIMAAKGESSKTTVPENAVIDDLFDHEGPSIGMVHIEEE